MREDERLIPIVKEAAKVSGRTYGTRRILEELKEKGHPCGRYKARRLMKLSGVTAREKKEVQGDDRSQSQTAGIPEFVGEKVFSLGI